jgi:hypothetical protein
MRNIFKILSVILIFAHSNSYAGKIQNEDVKSLSELTGAGGTASQLINTSKIYDVGTSQQLSSAFSGSIVGTLMGEAKVSCTADVSGILPVANGGTGVATIPLNGVMLGNTTSPINTVAPGTSGNVLQSNGTTWQSTSILSGGTSNARWVFEDAITTRNNVNGTHYQTATQSLTTVNLSMLNSGTSGSTTIRINQYRSGSLFNSATASIAASSGNPNGVSASLSGTLSLIAGDLETIDVTAVAGGLPESLTIEY